MKSPAETPQSRREKAARRMPLLADDYDLFVQAVGARSRANTITKELTGNALDGSVDDDEKSSSVFLAMDTIGKLDIVCFFFCAVGVSIGWSAILASLVYFSSLYGKTSFLYLQLAVYGPTFPTAILQSLSDSHFDVKFGSRLSFSFRVVFYFVGMAVCTALVPITSPDKNLGLLLALTAVVGLLSGFAYGTFYQLISIIRSQGRLQATFAMGYQGAGVFVFILQALFNETAGGGSQADLQGFFACAGAFEILALLCFLLLLRSPALTAALTKNDSQAAQSYQSLLDDDDDETEPAETYRSLTRKLLPILASLFLTIFSSIFVFPFYTFAQSSNANPRLPQYLFFIKLFSDALGRPATVLAPLVNTPRRLLVCCCLRLLLVPVFFIYIFTDLLPLSDVVFCIIMGFFSFSAGYLNTVCYQLAPGVVGEKNGAMVANIINTVFHTAVFVALILSTLVRYVGLSSIGD